MCLLAQALCKLETCQRHVISIILSCQSTLREQAMPPVCHVPAQEPPVSILVVSFNQLDPVTFRQSQFILAPRHEVMDNQQDDTRLRDVPHSRSGGHIASFFPDLFARQCTYAYQSQLCRQTDAEDV